MLHCWLAARHAVTAPAINVTIGLSGSDFSFTRLPESIRGVIGTVERPGLRLRNDSENTADDREGCARAGNCRTDLDHRPGPDDGSIGRSGASLVFDVEERANALAFSCEAAPHGIVVHDDGRYVRQLQRRVRRRSQATRYI